MPSFPYTLHDKPYDFLPKSYFVMYAVGDEDQFGRQTFTTMSALEKERELREHRESGSKFPWQGGAVQKPSDITFARGLAIKGATPGSEVTDGDFDNGLEIWFDSGLKFDCHVDVYNDISEDQNNSTPKIRFLLVRAKPKKYKSFDGDAKSSDTAMEELTVAVSDWKRVSTLAGPAAGTLTINLAGDLVTAIP